MNAIKSLLLASLFMCPANAFAQSVDKDPEAAAIVEFGGAFGWDLKGGGSRFGPNFAVEVTPIDTDLLFKKPWTLSKKVDFMFWPSAKRRFGWYLEPACDYSLAQGHESRLVSAVC